MAICPKSKVRIRATSFMCNNIAYLGSRIFYYFRYDWERFMKIERTKTMNNTQN